MARERIDDARVELGPVRGEHASALSLDHGIDAARTHVRRIPDRDIEQPEPVDQLRCQHVGLDDLHARIDLARIDLAAVDDAAIADVGRSEPHAGERRGIGIDLHADEVTRARREGGGEERAITAGRIDHACVTRDAAERGDRELRDRRGGVPLAERGAPRDHVMPPSGRCAMSRPRP